VDPAPRSATQSTIIDGLANGRANLESSSASYYVPAGKRLFETSWRNFAPRLGMGWQIFHGPSRRTVLRVGAGRFFDLGQEGFESSGYHATNAMTYAQQPLGSLTGGSLLSSYIPRIPAPPPVVVAQDYSIPYSWQWNTAIEQSIGQQTFS